MGFIFFLIFAVIIFVIMFLLSIIRGVGSFIFGRPSSSYSHQQGGRSPRDESDYDSSKSVKKIFRDNEGEYVKFEEVKD